MHLERNMLNKDISHKELANRLDVTPGRVSQILNGQLDNFSVEKIIEYARALEMKVSLVAYKDNDPGNTRGPIDSEIFTTCWERQGSPSDFFELNFEESNKEEVGHYIESSTDTNQIVSMGRLLQFPIRQPVETTNNCMEYVGQTDNKVKLSA